MRDDLRWQTEARYTKRKKARKVYFTTMSISERLAAHVTEIHYDSLPSSAVEKAKLCILDLFGAHYAGHRIGACDAVRGYLDSVKHEPQSTVWTTGARTAHSEAAFANSAIAHATVFDDMHAKTASHFGGMVIPAGIALAEYLGLSGKDLVAAVVAGYDAGIRIGSAMMNPFFSQSGFRPSGTFGTFASAVTAGKLFGLSPSAMVNAIGLAANFGVGLMAWADEGTEDLMYHNALACKNGMLAAILAGNGAKSPRRIFEDDGGFCRVYGGATEGMEQIVEKPDSHYMIEEVYFKSIPACAFVQSAARATLDIVKSRDFGIDDVRDVEVRIFPQGKHYPGLDYCGPFQGIMHAQMSNPYTIASILVYGRIRFENFTNPEDPAVRALSARVRIMEDEEAKSRWPAEQLAKVEVFLKDGSSRKAISENPHFLTPDEVVEKCRVNAGTALGRAATEKLIDVVLRIETLDDMGALTGIIRKGLESAAEGSNTATACA